MARLRLTFSSKKLNHYLVANSEEEVELLEKEMELKGFKLVRVAPFLERIGYEPTETRHRKRKSKRTHAD